MSNVSNSQRYVIRWFISLIVLEFINQAIIWNSNVRVQITARIMKFNDYSRVQEEVPRCQVMQRAFFAYQWRLCGVACLGLASMAPWPSWIISLDCVFTPYFWIHISNTSSLEGVKSFVNLWIAEVVFAHDGFTELWGGWSWFILLFDG